MKDGWWHATVAFHKYPSYCHMLLPAVGCCCWKWFSDSVGFSGTSKGSLQPCLDCGALHLASHSLHAAFFLHLPQRKRRFGDGNKHFHLAEWSVASAGTNEAKHTLLGRKPTVDYKSCRLKKAWHGLTQRSPNPNRVAVSWLLDIMVRHKEKRAANSHRLLEFHPPPLVGRFVVFFLFPYAGGKQQREK